MREESFDIVSGVLKFSEIEPDTETIPPRGFVSTGRNRAIKMFRLAKIRTDERQGSSRRNQSSRRRFVQA